jgi:hypothetical protein
MSRISYLKFPHDGPVLGDPIASTELTIDFGWPGKANPLRRRRPLKEQVPKHQKSGDTPVMGARCAAANRLLSRCQHGQYLLDRLLSELTEENIRLRPFDIGSHHLSNV